MTVTPWNTCFIPLYYLHVHLKVYTYSGGRWCPVLLQQSGCPPLAHCLSQTSVDHTATPGGINTINGHQKTKLIWFICFIYFLKPDGVKAQSHSPEGPQQQSGAFQFGRAQRKDFRVIHRCSLRNKYTLSSSSFLCTMGEVDPSAPSELLHLLPTSWTT